MIDFIEYVVSELKSNRLSKKDALSLIQQFASHAKSGAAIIHPLLHLNTSELTQQSYSTTFSGQEFFLDDHRVRPAGQDDVPVLPGVAYLEMARAAVSQAAPELADEGTVSLYDIIWAQPIMVPQQTTAAIVLDENDDEQVDFEVVTQQIVGDDVVETMHCQGSAVFGDAVDDEIIDLDALRERMQRGELLPDAIYPAFNEMGLQYGNAHQGVSVVNQGDNELLARLILPANLQADHENFVLHPSIMDSALQSSIGLLDSLDGHSNPSLPFGLEELHVLHACDTEMYAWVRYSPGSKADDKITKLDIDLCDRDGLVCVQFRRFTSRVLDASSSQPNASLPRGLTADLSGNAEGLLLAQPLWKAAVANGKTAKVAAHYVLGVGLKHFDASAVSEALETSATVQNASTYQDQDSVATAYAETVVRVFEDIKNLFSQKLKGDVQYQVVIGDADDTRLLNGLVGLFKSANLENPSFHGQVISLTDDSDLVRITDVLQQNQAERDANLVRYTRGQREVLVWESTYAREAAAGYGDHQVSIKDNGVYIITGGLGGLGVLFAKELVEQASHGHIVLTGRSALNDDKQQQINALATDTCGVEYQQVDISQAEQVNALIEGVTKAHGGVTGILHCAGSITDNFLLKKTVEEFTGVMSAKVSGTTHLDAATATLDLDFIALFSSGVGAFGNVGQGDYGVANGFMDQFAHWRNSQTAAGQRKGRTVSINWPLWANGGMHVDADTEAMLRQATGMAAMQTGAGIHAFYTSLASQQDQVFVVEGELARMEQIMFGVSAPAPTPSIDSAPKAAPVAQAPKAEKAAAPVEPTPAPVESLAPMASGGDLLTKTTEFLREQLSGLLHMPPHQIDPKLPLEHYGINSVLAINLTAQLEGTFGNLSKTLFFEYQTIAELSDYFAETYTSELQDLFGTDAGDASAATAPAATNTASETPKAAKKPTKTRASRSKGRSAKRSGSRGSSRSSINDEPIAIVGLSGRYPESENIQAYWENLRDGKDCVVEIPAQRWDWRDYYRPDEEDGESDIALHTSKWGGFIAGVDEFDPMFFNISPREAEYIDPQERLFLQHAWMALEDAGYTPKALQIESELGQAGQIGVYVGVMYGEYNSSGSVASIANRVSYVLNVHGPSMTLDTMCSSSLTSIHLACQDLKLGRTDLAIAGGVNVSVSPNKYSMLSAGQFISSDGHCQSFGEGGDGYIPGEGVGALLLKRLSEAERDLNPIHGLVVGSALNHGGKTNGYTVPNPQAQADVIKQAFVTANVDARHVSYIEAHGTGTKLGDPIEIAALAKAFGMHTKDKQFCLIGSAKSNIGHCESAAGVAGVTKVLLQMRYRKIVPSLHSARLNPNIDFPKTPFTVNQTLSDWEAPVVDGKARPRVAGVSSFGAGGSNAHILLQEYVAKADQRPVSTEQVLLPLSARTKDQLTQKAQDLADFITLRQNDAGSSIAPLRIDDMAYTLQLGRDALDYRLGFLVSSVEELAEKLAVFLRGDTDMNAIFEGEVNSNKSVLSLFLEDPDFDETVGRWIQHRKFAKLTDLWVKGLVLDWTRLYPTLEGDEKPRFVGLPTYPFAKNKYWIDTTAYSMFGATASQVKAGGFGQQTAALHPLIARNASTLSEYRLNSTFDASNVAVTQKVNSAQGDVATVSSFAVLEMTRIAAEHIADVHGHPISVQNLRWGAPIVAETGNETVTALSGAIPSDDGMQRVEFEVYTGQQVHAQGIAAPALAKPQTLNLPQIQAQLNRVADANVINDLLSSMQATATPAVTAVNHGDGQALVSLSFAALPKAGRDAFFVHPVLLEASVQAALVLLTGWTITGNNPAIPLALTQFDSFAAMQSDVFAYIRVSAASTSASVTFDIDWADTQGNVLSQARGLTLQSIAMTQGIVPAQPATTAVSSAPVEHIASTLTIASSTQAKPVGIKLVSVKDTPSVNRAAQAKPTTVRLAQHADAISAVPVAEAPVTTAIAPVTAIPAAPVVASAPAPMAAKPTNKEDLYTWLVGSLAEALYMETSEIDTQKSFVDLGLDSIVGVEWVKVINTHYGLDISATRVYDYSNVQQLAGFIAEELAKQPSSNTSIELPPTAAAPAPVDTVISAPASIAPAPTIAPLPVTPAPTPAPIAAATSMSVDALQHELIVSLAEALYMEPSDIELDKSFVDLGLDSIVGVEWVKTINTQYGLEISATRVYDYSNIKELALFVHGEMKTSAPIAAPQAAPTISAPVISAPSSISPPPTISAPAISPPPTISAPLTTAVATAKKSLEALKTELTASLAEALYMSVDEVALDKSFVDLGLDSIVGVEWVKTVNTQYGLEISATRVYDYSNLVELAGYVHSLLPEETTTSVAELPAEAPVAIAPASQPAASTVASAQKLSADTQTIVATSAALNAYPVLESRRASWQQLTAKVERVETVVEKPQPVASTSPIQKDPIAIVGISGRYPGANNLDEYWDNLVVGKNSVVEIPASRWDVDQYYDPDTTKLGKVYCKWLGMVDGAEYFDPMFFQISPSEAEVMDPQHRMFLQEGFKAFENAGYSGASLSGQKCGVYLGIMSTEYTMILSKDDSPSVNTTGNSFAIGAARIAYFLNLKGPAIPIDTACSSSLVAMHLGCQALQNHEIDMALAGGVSLYLVPESYQGMCQVGMLSADGQCKTFDNGANGFVPGEGAGAVVLKRLADAERDNNTIHGLIAASGINQDGKTNGITAPSVNSQIELERDIYERFDIHPESINYVETHGTGTKLGDPIELEALSTVFKEKTSKKHFCALGAVKSNLGHTSGAAGVAGVHKVLLSMRHKTLVPTLNVEKENALFNFESSPFYISRDTHEWKPAHGNVRRAAVSSFGFSGTNAHLVIQEYAPTKAATSAVFNFAEGVAVPLSARTGEQLSQRVSDLHAFLVRAKQTGETVQLVDLAYTLQVGRDAMRERLAFVVKSIEELTDKLAAFITNQKATAGVFSGQMTKNKDTLSMFESDDDLKAAVGRWMSRHQYTKVLDLWVQGLDVDWMSLYQQASKPKRIGLPTYPFAKERYWVDVNVNASAAPVSNNVVELRPNQQLPTTARQDAISEPKTKTYYRPVWNLAELTAAPSLSGETVVVFGADQALANAIEQQSQANVILVTLGAEFTRHSAQHFTVNIHRESDFSQVFTELADAGVTVSSVVHQAKTSDASLFDASVERIEDVTEQLNFGVYTLLALSKAIIAAKLNVVNLVSVFESSQISDAANAAIGGFLLTLNTETPRIKAKLVELQTLNNDTDALATADKAALIHSELASAAWDVAQVRYLHQRSSNQSQAGLVRHVKAFDAFQPAGLTQELPVKQNGVYLITGGLGGLGYIFSEYLAKNFHATLILIGRSALNTATEQRLAHLKSFNDQITYLQADASNLDDVERVVAEAKQRFGKISGVIHSAGVTKDGLVQHKTREDMERVLDPKVYGTINLDLATRAESLDCFVLFSSGAGALGNPGQCDYSFGNHFLDSFAESRDALRLQQRRSGKTLSINWPFWLEGGMQIPQHVLTAVEQDNGFCAIPTSIGIEYWEALLSTDVYQGLALYGYPSKIAAHMSKAGKFTNSDTATSQAGALMDDDALLDATQAYLKALVSVETKLTLDRIDTAERFEAFGFDSVMIGHINAELEKDLGEMPSTLLYEYASIDELTDHLVENYKAALSQKFNLTTEAAQSVDTASAQATVDSSTAAAPIANATVNRDSRIAIIGLHGEYPQSDSLDTFWENLKSGKDLIELVPSDRWDYQAFYDADPSKAFDGKIYCKWGGFLSDVDKFDPEFFGIIAEEAKVMDPQERLFIQSAWAAIEDAGYTRDSLKTHYPKAKSADVGVFVGVTSNTYHLLAPEGWQRGIYATPSSMPWSIANRVSYLLDLQGPSIPVDTACSSSLVAIHMACESLQQGDCQLAIAGGVNLFLHPSKYQSFCQRSMAAVNGKTCSFGAGDDGFVPSEGVGTLVLKPLAKAQADGDHVYATIAASAYDHAGRSNGYSAPNPNSQAALIEHTLNRADIPAETIGYIEGHGTGTQLGDSLEIAAISMAFEKQTERAQFCPIGSIKGNLGHSESAAGVSGITKIILQLQHQQLVPSLHSAEVNPNIDFETSPCYLQHQLSPWQAVAGAPRRALINSFGAGGVNACVVIEEHQAAASATAATGEYVFVLSAKNAQRLAAYGQRMLSFLQANSELSIADVCYTSAVGREAMTERFAVTVTSREQLLNALSAWLNGKATAESVTGSTANAKAKSRAEKKADKAEIAQLLAQRDMRALAARWAAGSEIDWSALFADQTFLRVSLPTYPFAKQRYWVSDDGVVAGAMPAAQTAAAQLHPLVSNNASTLSEVSFNSVLTSQAYYAQDHQLNGEKIFPGAAYLEMACVVGNIAGDAPVSGVRDLVWSMPLSLESADVQARTVLKAMGDVVDFQVTSVDDYGDVQVHSEGSLLFDVVAPVPSKGDVNAIITANMAQQNTEQYYQAFEQNGFNYGPSFRPVETFWSDGNKAVAKLALDAARQRDFDEYVLHPSLIDGALQTVVGLISVNTDGTPYMPFVLNEVLIHRPLTANCYAIAEFAEDGQQADIKKFNIAIVSESGEVLVSLNEFYVRALVQDAEPENEHDAVFS